MAVDTTTFAISLGLNAAIGLVFFMVFSFLRKGKLTRKYYAPKSYADHVVHRPSELPDGLLSWIGVVLRYPEANLINECGLDAAIFIRILRFGVTLFACLTFWCCALLIPVNITDDYVNELKRKDKKVVYSGIDKLYMTNVQPKSMRLWAHAISVYVVTFIVLKLLWKFNTDLSQLRINFMATVPKGGPTHTVLVTDIPGPLSGTVPDTLRRYSKFLPGFVRTKVDNAIAATYRAATSGPKSLVSAVSGATDTAATDTVDASSKALVNVDTTGIFDGEDKVPQEVMHPRAYALEAIRRGTSVKTLVDQEFKSIYGEDDVVGVTPVYNQDALAPLVDQYDKMKGLLEDLVDDYTGRLEHGKPIKRKEVRVIGALMGEWGKENYGLKPVKKDALEFYCDRLDELKRQVREAEPTARSEAYSTSFVTFSNRTTQSVATTGLHSHDEGVWKVQEAPGADEIIWANLRLRSWERSLRTILSWVIFITMLLTFGIVCAAIQGLINPQQLKDKPVIETINKVAFLRAIISGILPGLVLMIFFILLPSIIAAINRFAGMVSLSQIDLGVVSKFYIFQFFTVFLISALSGTLLSNFKSFIKSGDIVEILNKVANGIPQQATFFMTWVQLQALSARPFGFLRIVGFVVFWIFSKLAATKRAETRLWANQTMMYGTSTASHMMTVLYGIVFCVQAPIIAPVCLIYFVVCLIVDKYQTLYVFTVPYETYGRLWPRIYRQAMVAVYFFQLVLIVQLGLKQFPYAVLLLPVPLATLAFDRCCVKQFDRPWRLLSLRAAAELDMLDQKATGHAGLSAEERAKAADTYLSPAFKVSDEEHAALLQEAKELAARLSKGSTDPEAAAAPVTN